MKKLFLLFAVFAAIALPKAAQADFYDGMCCMDTGRFYAGGLGGLNWIQYNKSHNSHSNNFKTGWAAGGFIGYKWCEGFRLEAEATYRHTNVKNRSGHFSRNIRTWCFMGNGYYEIPVCFCITPYIGAGIGYDTVQSKSCSQSSNSRNNKHKNGFAWQVIAGGLYPIDDCLEMALEYRFHEGKPKDLYNHTLDLRLNWFF